MRLSTRRSVADLFVDTGAFYAVADSSDSHHAEARAAFKARAASGDLITTDHVVVESWLLLRARLGRNAAMKFWDALMTDVVQVVGVSSADLIRAREIAREWPDQDFSLIDCTSFAAMERLGLEEAFAFDSHFRTYRFGPSRDKAFQVVP
jgi:predicted nucleic acid-binding protein